MEHIREPKAGDPGGAGSTVRADTRERLVVIMSEDTVRALLPRDLTPGIEDALKAVERFAAGAGDQGPFGGVKWTLAERIVIVVAALEPDLPPDVVATALRHAATRIDPEVAQHDMDPALDLLEVAASLWLDVAEGREIAASPLLMGNLGEAIDRAEDELAPYVQARATARKASGGVGGRAGAVVEAEARDADRRGGRGGEAA